MLVHAKDLFVEANVGPLAPLHCWLTNRKNDSGSYCAAPMPNQKRRCPFDLLVHGAPLRWTAAQPPSQGPRISTPN